MVCLVVVSGAVEAVGVCIGRLVVPDAVASCIVGAMVAIVWNDVFVSLGNVYVCCFCLTESLSSKAC